LPDSIFSKNLNLGRFWRVLKWKIMVNLIAIGSILLPFGLFYCHLVYFMVIWYTYFSRFGMLYQEKSGNPDYAWLERMHVSATCNAYICICIHMYTCIHTYSR
jgi:hypothetical protein